MSNMLTQQDSAKILDVEAKVMPTVDEQASVLPMPEGSVVST